jgi:hypothetical protein
MNSLRIKFRGFYNNSQEKSQKNSVTSPKRPSIDLTGSFKGSLFNNDPQLVKMIESSKNEYVEPMKKLLQYSRRDIINEVCEEFENRGNFIRIFPTKNSNIYDKFFTGQRPMN